jgi:hypothetical protein
MKRTYIYVDGFNLYYGALKNTPHKWLDLKTLFQSMLSPDNNIEKITVGIICPFASLAEKIGRMPPSFTRHINSNLLKQSQFPQVLPKTNIKKPDSW